MSDIFCEMYIYIIRYYVHLQPYYKCLHRDIKCLFVNMVDSLKCK